MMFNKKEVFSLLIAALVIGYLYSLNEISWMGWLSMAGLALAILFIHHLGQKLASLFYDCTSELHLWTVRQFGLRQWQHFRFDFPFWFIVPAVLAVITFPFTLVKWLAVTTFEATPLPSRIRRRYAEITEWHLALIATGGLFMNAILALVSQIAGWNDFAMLNLYFILFNLVPLSKLDGSKIFFGSPMLWIFAVVFTLAMIIFLGTISPIATIVAAVFIAIAAVILYYTTYE